MPDPLPVLHIGFNKAGSTTLQNGLFARHPEVASLGEPFKREHLDVHEAMFNVMKSCHRDPAQRVEFNLERCRALWQQALAAIGPGKVPVYSKESMVSAAFYDAPTDARLPTKLRAVVGGARIVIMARHQIKLLESLYITRNKGHSYRSPDEWFEENDRGSLYMFRYNAIAESYAEAFGRENVGVFLLEDLQADVGAFAKRLCDFIGIDGDLGARLLAGQKWNTRTSQRMHTYSRLRKRFGPDIRLNRYVPGSVRDAFVRFIGGGSPAKVELPSRWVSEMRTYYGEDNRQLAARWGLPLEKYGYPL